ECRRVLCRSQLERFMLHFTSPFHCYIIRAGLFQVWNGVVVVCVCVCVYVCMYVLFRPFVCVCVCVLNMSVLRELCVCVCVYVCCMRFVCVCVCVLNMSGLTELCVCVCVLCHHKSQTAG